MEYVTRGPGGIAGVGGRTIRDVLLAQVPAMLRADVDATAALAGAAVVVHRSQIEIAAHSGGNCGVVICFLLRVVSVGLHSAEDALL